MRKFSFELKVMMYFGKFHQKLICSLRFTVSYENTLMITIELTSQFWIRFFWLSCWEGGWNFQILGEFWRSFTLQLHIFEKESLWTPLSNCKGVNSRIFSLDMNGLVWPMISTWIAQFLHNYDNTFLNGNIDLLL